MKILHTADWHVGKRLGRYDRMEDHRAVLGEVVEIADTEDVDLVLVAGDLFDRPTPPVEALRTVLEALTELASPHRPVVAISGNHDSGELFELLAPLLRSENVHLVGALRPPEAGGTLTVETKAGPAAVGCFPFLPHGRAVDFTAPEGEWAHRYAARIAAVCAAFEESFQSRTDDAVTLFLAHLTLDGVRLGRRGAPRGERALHVGDAYAAPALALPSSAHYTALGHIHLPQPLPGKGVSGEYAGSLLELDFGEAGEEKRVVIVEIEGDRTVARTVAIQRGRRLRRARGRWQELADDDSLRDVYLDLQVETSGPDPGLADRAREAFPFLVKVRTEYPESGPPRPSRRHLPWDEQYRDYYRESYETDPTPELLAAFGDVWSEVRDATA